MRSHDDVSGAARPPRAVFDTTPFNAGAWLSGAALATALMAAGTATAIAGSPFIGSCDSTQKAPFCAAVRGDRSEGWVSQGRSEVMARNGIVSTSQPLAAQAGLRILMEGGNAIDAAVATAATLNLVEPMNVGLGGDLFAIVYIAREHKLYTLNASGKAPSGETLAHMNALGYQWNSSNWGPGSGMPSGGITTVTVPGAAWGWDEMERRFGRLSFRETLQPAIDYAEHGFPISERIAHDWTLPKALGPNPSSAAGCCTQVDPDSVAVWYPNGVQPVAGQIFRNPGLAETFKLLQRYGRDVFYKGEIAQAIVAKSNAVGGTMTLQDLASYRGEWTTAATSNYHGVDVFTLPAPSQNWATDEMLNILEVCMPKWSGQTLAQLGPANPLYWHFLVEAKKVAFADLYQYNGDPDFNPGLQSFIQNTLLSKSYAASLCSKVSPTQASSTGPGGNYAGLGDTIVLSAADRWGNMVSWVNSNYATFGSGLTVPKYGFILHNRGGLFTLKPNANNTIAPGKRPYNTLSAAFLMQGGQPLMTLELMGGDMQAQGHAQMVVNIVDLGANLQASTDMARFYHNQVPNVLQLETQLYNLVGSQLKAMGHNVQATGGGAVGGYQAIMFTPDATEPRPYDDHHPVNGFYRAGSDHRKDGEAVGW